MTGARKDLFSRALGARPERLHFAAHSHHPWPDVTFEAQMVAWTDAAERLDDKWERVMGTVLPEVQGHIARVLGWRRPEDIALAPNTHEFLLRLFSCFDPTRPLRVLSTDGEFHSFTRQATRLVEAGQLDLERVAVEPFETFPERFATAARSGEYDLVFVSHVFFNSGYVYEGVFDLAREIDPRTYFVVDGYHGFCALPTDLAPYDERVFYLSGAYKYAMSGEGVCFLCCPPGYAQRPLNTGWFASFGALAEGRAGDVGYSTDGYRMFGSTFDPTGLYRFRAVMDLWQREGITVEGVHRHVQGLQTGFLERLSDPERARAVGLSVEQLVPGPAHGDRGHFLTFRVEDAGERYAALKAQAVITDYRADRWRFGFGLYQDEADLDELFARLAR